MPLQHQRRAERAGGDAGKKLTLGQPVRTQAAVDVERASKRNALERQLLIVHPKRRKPGEQNPDERDKADDETKPNHSLAQKMRSWRKTRSSIWRPPGRQQTETE